MQTFLPYPGFEESAAVLDQARLGKQRVETLQTLRALIIPDYGWRQHPAIRMWMGHVPALARYGLAMVDEWTGRGHSDATRQLLLEFAPEIDTGTDTGSSSRSGSGADVPVPPWLGENAFHLSHQSNLIQKAPSFYRNRFPGVPDDLPYVWPTPDEVLLPSDPDSDRLWIWRSHSIETDLITMPPVPSSGRSSAKWQRQLAAFTGTVAEGDAVAVTDAAGARFRTGVVGPLTTDDDGAAARVIRPTGELLRSDFERPALLQDPRTFFSVPMPSTGP